MVQVAKNVAIVLAVLAANAAYAQSLPPVNLGATSFVDGAPPAGPGIYFNQYVQYYGARRLMDGNGDAAPLPDPKLDAWITITQLIFLCGEDVPGLKAKPGLDVVLPTVSTDLDFAAPGPFPRDNGGGLGDLLLGPALQFDPIMGPCGPRFVHRVEAQFIIPTGKYSGEREINPGAGFFSFNPYWAGTLFLTPKLTASYRAHYLWNAENDNPAASLGVGSIKAGEAFHTNFTLAMELVPQRLRAGLNGYYLRQTTDTQFDGIAVPGLREQVLGIGPGVLVSFSQEQHLFVNVYIETEARNRPEGTRVNLRYVHKF